MIITVGHEKGGCGKTTTATNLAVWLLHHGADVLLVDADKQSSASHWASVREGDSRLAPIRCVQLAGHVTATLRDLATRYEHLIIDCGGRDSVELRSSLLVADVLISPVRPSQLDLWAMEHLVNVVVDARALNPALRALAVLTMTPTNVRVREASDAREMLGESEVFELAASSLCDRKAYRDAICGGWSVLEMDDDKAVGELLALGKEIYGQVSQRAAVAV